MRFRKCDSCGKEIPTRTKYYRILETFWDGVVFSSKMVGDMCEKCYKEMKNG